MLVWVLLILVFVLAVAFTWTNGFQHASAVASGAIATHSLELHHAMVLICVFEIVGTMLSGSAVAGAIQSLSSWPEQPSLLPLLASALTATIVWNIFTQKLGIPSSSTHTLIGAMIGSLFAGDFSFDHIEMGKFDILHPSGVIGAWISLVLSPLLGVIVAYVLFCIVTLLCLKAPAKIEKYFRSGQWVTVAVLAFSDGGNDTQKTMGLLVLALNGAGLLNVHDIPIWVRAIVAVPMGLGAFWMAPAVAKKLAFKVYNLRPTHAAVAEVSASSVLIANSIIGGPVSASQVISAAVMGTGTAERYKGIHWLIIKDILLSWLITIPAAAVVAFLVHITIFQWFSRAL